ncbi:MAG: hypothetical protein ACR2H0_00390 [Candidatus Limnocylindrales bacterium]
MAGPVGWCARLAAALFVAVFGGAAGVAAHQGSSAYMLVAQDFILPGQQFELIAADIGSNAALSIEIAQAPVVAQLGTVQAAGDGHFTATFSLPSDFPGGYAQIIATASDGTETSTWVFVGQGTASTPPPPGSGSWWTDPSVLVLVGFVIGAAGVAGYLLLRPRRRRPATAAAAPTRTRVRTRRPGPPRAGG